MKKARIAWVMWLMIGLVQVSLAGGEKGSLGIGLRAGMTQFEADVPEPVLCPFVYGHVKFNPSAFLSLGTEFGWGELKDKERKDLKTTIMPFELDLTFNFLPLGKVNPYVLLGGGGVYWSATNNGQPVFVDMKKQEGIDSFLKTGGGLEFILNQQRNVTFSIGATFRYSFTDFLDQRYSGDENDQVVDIYGGLTYYFKTSTKGDVDSDGVPDGLDLEQTLPEDPDGYMDHDGKPDDQPEERFAEVIDMLPDTSRRGEDTVPPVVIHVPVRRAEEGREVPLNVEVIENREIRVVSVLYRILGETKWQVRALRSLGSTMYQGSIPNSYVRSPGVEYCVVAVDEAVSGIGYSGLPKRPNVIKVIAKPKQWRILAATAAILGWGSAGYLISRKQK
ncbi:hypothetical protein L0128_20330 [candidate division KSB1 bacterium]|nr:hypothetical protein [candidate division KSB1 bacterium]